MKFFKKDKKKGKLENIPIYDTDEDLIALLPSIEDLDKKSKKTRKKKIDLMPKKKNNKLIIFGAVFFVLLILVVVFLLIPKQKEPVVETPVKSENQIKVEETFSAINKGLKIGESKDSVISKLSIPKDNIGKNYAIDTNYTRIENHDFLSTYIFFEDSLVAIVHERILDGTQKHKLSIEFQNFTQELGEYYPLIGVREEWFSNKLEYDANAWNNAITKNQLELYSEFENQNKEYMKVVASGINYFNFLANDRESLSIGNLILVYTSTDYKDNFMQFVTLATE